MSTRHRRSPLNPAINPRIGIAGAAGLAGLAALFAAAPAGHADPAPNDTGTSTGASSSDAPSTDGSSSDTSSTSEAAPSSSAASSSSDAPPTSDAPSTTASSSGAPSASTSTAPGSDAPTSNSGSTSSSASSSSAAPAAGKRAVKAALEPNFGGTKIRIAVQTESGAYLPNGTTGSVLSIVEKDGTGATVKTSTCTTVANTTANDPTYCPSDGSILSGSYYAAPGDSVTITQTSAPAGAVIDPLPQTVPACPAPGGFPFGCSADAVFTDTGLLPVAHDDTAGVQSGSSVDVDVLANDDPNYPSPTISAVTQPAHGTVTIVGAAPAAPAPAGGVQAAARAAASAQTVRYTPRAGFSGTDPFTYTITTPNGTASARVTVSVTAPPTPTPKRTRSKSHSAAPTSASSSSSSAAAATNSSTAETGTPSLELVEIGAGLLALGGVATVGGRRRRRGGRAH